MEEHRAAYRKTGFWGRAGAGSLVVAEATGRFLLPKRAEGTLDPHTWATWGGAVDPGETPEEAALRELREEAGFAGSAALRPLYLFRHESGFRYHNFLAVVGDEFTPDPNWEIADFGWFGLDRWPAPLHFGLERILDDAAAARELRRAAGK